MISSNMSSFKYRIFCYFCTRFMGAKNLHYLAGHILSWCFILFPRLPEMSNFAHRNSFFMSHVISLWLVRTCNLQVLTSHREMSFELKGNANLIRYSDLCYPQQKLVASPGYWTPVSWVWSQDSTTELNCLCWKWGEKPLYICYTNMFWDILAINKKHQIEKTTD